MFNYVLVDAFYSLNGEKVELESRQTIILIKSSIFIIQIITIHENI